MGIKNIVLLHGWGATIQKLELLKKELEKHEWNVFIPGLPGFDLSDPPSAWNLDDYSKYIFDKSSVFFRGKKFYLFGHSFGGAIAVKTSLGKDASLLSGLILCAIRGITRTNVLKRLFFWILAKIGKVFLVFPVLANFWKTIVYKLAREHDYEKSRGVMKKVFKNVVSEDLRFQVSRIKIPTLILWGFGDKMTPIRGAYYLRDRIENSKLVTFGGVGHRLPYERSKELAKEINKWAENLH